MEANMKQDPITQYDTLDPEIQDWIDSLHAVTEIQGPQRSQELLGAVLRAAYRQGVSVPAAFTSDYINTIHHSQEKPYPGDRELEERLMRWIRWNALAMVVRANRLDSSIGGHISTYASSAYLYEVGFNHFFRGKDAGGNADLIFVQGHASPGIYARAFLEGRLNETQLINFRRELQPGGGLSSYPHPWLMPDFWEFPTVSMGLGPLTAIYQARFAKYLVNRGLKAENNQKVWAFLGDGEMDEPESLGAIHIASREKLDNLIFVINCNLQRLDGPVRGNGKIVQELEGIFKGAGWNVLKVMWSGEWDPIFEKDTQGHLTRSLEKIVDGNVQKFEANGAAELRKMLIDHDARNASVLESVSDEELATLKRGGHDAKKVFNAYDSAFHHSEGPTVILAQTVKGFGLGKSGEAANVTHQKKKLTDEEVKEFRDRFDIPVSDDQLQDMPFYRPAEDSPEMAYLKEKRTHLQGYLPKRRNVQIQIGLPDDKVYQEFYEGTKDREVSTTMAFVKLLANLLKDKEMGKQIVPIVPDEARTFGMESMFRQVGIYAPFGQKYDPIDKKSLLYYKESQSGQILEEGITEAGAMASFIAAGTSHENHEVPTIPFFIYYSMFGFQRVGDLIWAACDQRTRGFLLGATAGRTTLAGEGLQHQDGHSHLNALAFPNIKAYDPAFAYETAVIVKEGLRRMYQNNEDIFYYLTLENENYAMPAMPEGVEEGILKGLYTFEGATLKQGDKASSAMVHLMASGSIMTEAIKAKKLLEQDYGISTDLLSVTSYKELYRDCLASERTRLIEGDGNETSHLESVFKAKSGVVVAASDYVKTLPLSISRWIPNTFVALGTDGFGLSETRESLREHFEVDAASIAFYALSALAKDKKIDTKVFEKAKRDLNIQFEKGKPYGLI